MSERVRKIPWHQEYPADGTPVLCKSGKFLHNRNGAWVWGDDELGGVGGGTAPPGNANSLLKVLKQKCLRFFRKYPKVTFRPFELTLEAPGRGALSKRESSLSTTYWSKIIVSS